MLRGFRAVIELATPTQSEAIKIATVLAALFVLLTLTWGDDNTNTAWQQMHANEVQIQSQLK